MPAPCLISTFSAESPGYNGEHPVENGVMSMDKQTRGSVALPNAFQAVWKTARQPWAAKILRQGGMAGMGYLLAGVELLEGAHPLGLAWGAAFCRKIRSAAAQRRFFRAGYWEAVIGEGALRRGRGASSANLRTNVFLAARG